MWYLISWAVRFWILRSSVLGSFALSKHRGDQSTGHSFHKVIFCTTESWDCFRMVEQQLEQRPVGHNQYWRWQGASENREVQEASYLLQSNWTWKLERQTRLKIFEGLIHTTTSDDYIAEVAIDFTYDWKSVLLVHGVDDGLHTAYSLYFSVRNSQAEVTGTSINLGLRNSAQIIGHVVGVGIG